MRYNVGAASKQFGGERGICAVLLLPDHASIISHCMKITAIFKNGVFSDFGIMRGFAHIYGEKESDIVDVEFCISQNQDIPAFDNKNLNPDYWGWFDFKSQSFELIYPKYILLDMCFPCGIKIQEAEKKDGKAYRIDILSHK
jgi:hypothetical protein